MTGAAPSPAPRPITAPRRGHRCSPGKVPGTVAGPGVRKALIGADNTAADGARVITYNGWPLYFFIGDNGPGQDTGQGQGHDWYVISPSGQVIRAPAQ